MGGGPPAAEGDGEAVHTMTSEKLEFMVPEESDHARIDVFLAHSLELDFSRSYIQKLIRAGHVRVNGLAIRPNHRVRPDESIELEIPEPEKLDLEAEDLPLPILYEDSSLAVVNKPAGMVAHPGGGHRQGTLVNALLHHIRDLSSIGGTERPGIVHRLDKDTAGLMLVAKEDLAHRFLMEEFAGRRVVKRYTALCSGKPREDHGVIDGPIGRHPTYRHKMTVRDGGRQAITEFRLTRVWHTPTGVFSLMDILLHTGRTHQIRVHLSSSGLPIVGDPLYSKKWEKYGVPYLLLASVFLEFTHPRTGERMSFQTPVPQHIADFIKKLEK